MQFHHLFQKRIIAFQNDKKGSVLIEFALVLNLFLLPIFIGVYDFQKLSVQKCDLDRAVSKLALIAQEQNAPISSSCINSMGVFYRNIIITQTINGNNIKITGKTLVDGVIYKKELNQNITIALQG